MYLLCRIAGQSIRCVSDDRTRYVAHSCEVAYISYRRGVTWTEPKPLRGGVNADGYDVFPFLSPDGKTLYFIRDFSAFYSVPLDVVLPR